jgi:AcrR family transcriptional regulator
LIEATIDSIVEKGLSATTLATVAEAAGLSQGVAVFYFRTKENLLAETLRYHYEQYVAVWREALGKAPDDPVERICALFLADLDERICTHRNAVLWSSFWGETKARPKFTEICEHYDRERYDILLANCEAAGDSYDTDVWDPVTIAEALDSLTAGMWMRVHLSPEFPGRAQLRCVLVRYLATLFPVRRDEILAK